MGCFFDHNWGWPRRRGGKDIQICPDCGAERESRVHFDGPRYRRTQEGLSVFPEPPRREAAAPGAKISSLSTAAA